MITFRSANSGAVLVEEEVSGPPGGSLRGKWMGVWGDGRCDHISASECKRLHVGPGRNHMFQLDPEISSELTGQDMCRGKRPDMEMEAQSFWTP